MNNTLGKKGWGVHLVGHPFDLADWGDTLKVPFDPWVERQDDQYFLRTAQFDPLASAAEVRDHAVSIVDQLNAAMEIKRGSRPIHFEGVVEFRSDGTRGTHMFVAVGSVEARARAAAVGVVITKDGVPAQSPAPTESDVQQWAALSEKHDLLADALIYFSRLEWFDVYKAIECLEDWVKQSAPHARRRRGTDILRNKKWISGNDFDRLRRTANSFRHRQGGENSPPEDPPSLADARAMLGTLIAKAFETAKNDRPSAD